MVSSFGWQWAFFINVPLGIIAVVMAQKLLRETPAQPGTRFDVLGFLTAASGSAILLYSISAVSSGSDMLWNSICFMLGIILLSTFALIELSKARRGQQPLLDLRRFRDRAFGFSVLALVFVAFIRFGILFLIPIYLQNLHQQSAFQAGLIQAAQALSTLAILPIGGRLTDKLGPRPVVLAGLILMTVSALLMVTLALDTAIWLIMGILLLLGAANALVQQIPVAAMSRIKNEEHKEIANGSTLVTVLHATAAPMGVAILASVVQVRSQHYLTSLGLQGLTGKLLQHQSTLLGMHESFLIAASLAVVAFIVMCFVPGNKKRIRQQSEQPEQAVVAEELAI
ncbi:MFS transporter [Dictyobacter vulcani]|uniref:MFS transporter n=1 Tax=Dictyobacter vulcani TaxID=2607529 RepID=UPI00125066C0|nr:MFS transporter [Dictyobacter vulcani]